MAQKLDLNFRDSVFVAFYPNGFGFKRFQITVADCIKNLSGHLLRSLSVLAVIMPLVGYALYLFYLL